MRRTSCSRASMRGEISAAPPKQTPPGIQTATTSADAVAPPHEPPVAGRSAAAISLAAACNALAARRSLLLLVACCWRRRARDVVAARAARWSAALFAYRADASGSPICSRVRTIFKDGAQTPEIVDRLPKSPDFRIADLRRKRSGRPSARRTARRRALQDRAGPRCIRWTSPRARPPTCRRSRRSISRRVATELVDRVCIPTARCRGSCSTHRRSPRVVRKQFGPS